MNFLFLHHLFYVSFYYVIIKLLHVKNIDLQLYYTRKKIKECLSMIYLSSLMDFFRCKIDRWESLPQNLDHKEGNCT